MRVVAAGGRAILIAERAVTSRNTSTHLRGTGGVGWGGGPRVRAGVGCGVTSSASRVRVEGESGG
eukprot:1075026-Prymnesium_polylepis.1